MASPNHPPEFILDKTWGASTMQAKTIRSCALLAVLAVLLPACNHAAEAVFDSGYVATTMKVQELSRAKQNSTPALGNNPHNRPNHTPVLIVSQYEVNPFTGRATIDWESYFRP